MWTEQGPSLVREFKFNDFKTALDFVNQVGKLADEKNHHPDIEFGWGYVRIKLTTHSVNGVTTQDRELANLINQIN